MPGRRRLFLALVLIMAAVLGPSMTGRPQAPEKIKVALHWNAPNAAFTHHYAAKKLGFYAAEGLDVELLALPGSVPAVTSVASGEAQFGQAGSDAILVGVSKGAQLRARADRAGHVPLGWGGRTRPARTVRGSRPADVVTRGRYLRSRLA